MVGKPDSLGFTRKPPPSTFNYGWDTAAADRVGSDGVIELTNGNYVVVSPFVTIGGQASAGAVTWGSGAAGVTGTVSVTNSLTGTTSVDAVGSAGVVALANGNYVVRSPNWNNGGVAASAGAVTFGSGATGISGAVSAANSLVGTTAGDQVGSAAVTELANGNYVVGSPEWANGLASRAGAATWGSGTTGIIGAVTTANSLVGSNTNDAVGSSVTAFPNGNYVAISANWDNGATSNAGALTWGSGLTGVNGVISAANSLVGTSINDLVGSHGITVLTNSNYVVRSPNWRNGVAGIAGAVTFATGTAAIIGAVSTANSLVGTTTGDSVGLDGVVALPNGNYVVRIPGWNNGGVSSAGAVTFGSGTSGITGAVSAANSLVGTSTFDFVGDGGITVLPNGNYVVSSPSWSNGGAISAGAVTFGSGTSGITGAVSAANSLVGSTSGDRVGNGGITALANGNYVVASTFWSNGLATNAGAVTFGNGLTGITGVVSPANSLVGTTTNDQVGVGGVTALPNGNYVVRSYEWANGAATQAGAVTFGNGATGISGAVSAANSLVGTTSGDFVGEGGITVLPNGNHVVSSFNWSNSGAINTGAVTWGSGSIGVSGAVSAANSLVGVTANDFVGATFPDSAERNITPLANGNFLVGSERYTNGGLAGAGKLQIYVPGGLNNPLVFSDSPASTVTITPSQITDITNTGTAIVLQANNDITLAAASDIITTPVSGNGGDITLQAGRSVMLNSNINSANGNITIVANETAANGVFDAHRSAGAAEIRMAPGTTINSGTGNISLTLSTGAGLTNNQSGAIEVANLTTTTGSVSVVNTGSGVGGGPIDMVATPAAITSPLITLHGSAIGTTTGHVHLDPVAGSVFATANTGGISVEQIAGTLNTGQYSFSAPAGQEVRLASSSGNINVNNSLTLAGENLVLQTFGPYDIQFASGRAIGGSGLLTLQPDAGRSVLLPASGTTTLNVDTDVLTGTLAFAGPGGTLTGTGNVILHAGTTFDWGFGGTVAGTGVLGTDGAVNITSANLSRQWDNFGIATWTPGAADSFTLTAAGVLNNQLGAKFIINSPLASFGGLRAITGAGAINNAGEFNKELNGSPVSTLVATTFNNQTGGAVHVNSGVLQFTGGGTDAGAYVVPAGSALEFTGGARTLGAGSSVTGAGDVNFSGSQLTTFAAGSTYAPTGGTTVSGGTVSFNQGGINVFNLVMTGGSLAGSAAVAVSNSLNWSGGTVDTTGTLTTAGPSTISATDTLNGPWANNGAADLTGGALTVGSLINAGTFNVSGGTHTLSGPTSGTGAVNIGGGTTTIGGTYNQASTAVNAGTVTFTGTPTLNSFVQTGGTANLNAGGTATDVNLGGASGTLNLGGGTLSTSNYTQTAGAVAGSGALNVSGALIWSGGTIDTTGTLTTSGSSAISATDTLNGAWANNGAANITGGALAINALTNTATLTLSGGTHALNGPTSGAGAIDFSGATVTVGGTYNPANTSVSGGLVTFTNTPTLNNYVQAGGTVNLNAGGSATSVNLSGAGSILNLSGGTLTASSHTQSGGAVTGTGALITAGMNWTGGTIDTAGTLTISGASIISATDTLNGAWINNGTADITGGTLTTNALTNAGTLNILGGNQTLNGPTGGAGAINFAGGTASVGGTFNPLTTNVTAGSVTFTSAPALNNYTQTGGAANLTAGGSAANVNLSGGTLNLGGVFNPSSYTQSGGAVTGTGALNVTGPMNWTGGTLDTTGTLTTAGASNFSASDTLNGAWNNNGAAVLSGGAMTFNTLNNTGTLDITGGTQTFNGPTLGTGGLTVNGGTATINGSYSHANTNVAAGTLTFASAPALANFTQTGGTANFNAGGSATNINLSGAGSTLNVNGGTLIATNFTQSGGVFDGAGAFSATTLYNVTGGTQTGTGATILAPGSTYTPGTTTLGRSLIVQGTLNENAGDTLTIAAGRTLTVNGTLNNAGTITGAGDLVTALGSTFSLSGALAGTGASVLNGVTNASSGASINRNVVSNAAFNLSGSMSVNGGQLQLNNGGSASGLMNVANGGVLLFSGGTYNFASGGFTGAGTTTIAGATVNVPSLNLTGFGMVTGGQLNVAGTTSIAPAGVMTVTGGVLNANGQLFVDGTLQSTPPGVINTNGAVTIGGVLDLGNGTLQTTSLNVIGSGVLKGKGTINGNVVLGGMFKPGASPGVVNINGNYTQTGTLEVELGGTTPGTGYDQIVVSGTANLGGTLNVVQFGNFISPPGATFQVVRAGTINGTFANTNVPLIFSGLNASYTSQFVELGSATITTASTLTQVDPAIIKQDKELVATIKKILGSDPVEEALNPASSEKKSNTPNCN